MRARARPHSCQQSLSFARLDVWQSIPAEEQQRCRELCEHLFQAILDSQVQAHSEVPHDGENRTRTS